MESLRKLNEIFSDFPGIGPRQAKRFVYFLLAKNPAYLKDFSRAILELKKNIKTCTECFRFYSSENQKSSLCNICSSKNRDTSLLMIVAKDIDFENVEKSGSFGGKYFILGGSVPILEKEPEKRIRIKELLNQIERLAKNGLKEIIIALNLTPEGENTADFVEKTLKPKVTEHSLKITTLGRGISTGSELEYLDSDTIKNALSNRKEEKLG